MFATKDTKDTKAFIVKNLVSFVSFVSLVVNVQVYAQGSASTRVAILTAEDKRAPTPRDLAVIRAGAHSRDPETALVAIRALGRLERPALIPDIAPLLKSKLPEIRGEAANALGQAAQGLKVTAPARTTPATTKSQAPGHGSGQAVAGVQALLIARLRVEEEPGVRAVLCATIGRLPYTDAADVQRAEAALLEALAHEESVDGRVGIAHGFEALVRLHHAIAAPSPEAVARLQDLVKAERNTRDARMRRLVLEAVIAAGAANSADEQTVARAMSDPDVQVRRLAVRAASISPEILAKAASDPAPMVRIDALRRAPCESAVAAVTDPDVAVALTAIDRLQACHAPDAIDTLARLAADVPPAGSPRGWHRAAHAIVALAAADAERGRAALSPFIVSDLWPLRMYAARAATVLADRPTLERLASDRDDNVCEAAIAGLSKVAGHDTDRLYIAALSRRGYQVLREAARALSGTGTPGTGLGKSSNRDPSPADRDPSPAIALNAALQALIAEGRDNSHDARVAMADALESLGARVDKAKAAHTAPIVPALSAEDLRRLAAARARVTIRGVGAFEFALFAAQAPATVVRFTRLAESGYYNGLTFHRVVPNFVIQGGSPGANEYIGDASYMRDEVGLWPHVRGAVGISTRGRDTGDAQIFIDLVDNPRLDHEYTVFAQVVNGMDVVDRILEGDTIERVEILTQQP